MTSYFLRQDGRTATGPYETDVVKAWLGDGRLAPEAEVSPDGAQWTKATEVGELGRTPKPGAAPTAASSSASPMPEPTLLIRQGANVQGPFKISRIRGYVAQRRIQPYMLFSQDGIFWVGAEYIPGLIPDGYVPVQPPARPSAVPEMAVTATGQPVASAPRPAPAPPPQPGADTGSITLVGFRLDKEEMGAPSIPASRPPPMPARPFVPAFPGATSAAPPSAPSYYVRQAGRDVYGPFPEGVVRGWIDEGRVSAGDEYSFDGRTWVPGVRVPGLFSVAPTSRVPGSRDEEPAEDPPRSSRWRGFRGGRR